VRRAHHSTNPSFPLLRTVRWVLVGKVAAVIQNGTRGVRGFATTQEIVDATRRPRNDNTLHVALDYMEHVLNWFTQPLHGRYQATAQLMAVRDVKYIREKEIEAIMMASRDPLLQNRNDIRPIEVATRLSRTNTSSRIFRASLAEVVRRGGAMRVGHGRYSFP